VELKVVIDTNVLVSGLLKRGTPPAEVIADLLEGDLRVLYDGRIIDEYGEVLARPKFKIPQDRVRDLLDFVVGDGIEVIDAQFPGRLPHVKDQPFADVGYAGGADLLITGNSKHFTVGRALRVVSPREWSDIKKRMEILRSLGDDERLALAPPDEPYPVAVACKRCGTITISEIQGLEPRAEPQRAPFACRAPDPGRAEGVCGGEVWSYDDNDLGRRQAAAGGTPTRKS
jgi:putative PIN family toxin of toxin-antitoxin system